MVLFRKWLFVALVLLVPICAKAENPGNSLTYELYAKSGLEKQIEQLPLAIKAGVVQLIGKDHHRLRQMPRNLLAKLTDTLPESFSSESIKKTMLERIETRMDWNDIRAILKWLDSPIGRKCTQLEEAASSPEAVVEILKDFPTQLKKTPPSPERLTLVRKLDSATNTTEMSAEIVMNMQLAVSTAFAMSLPSENQSAFLKKMMQETERMRPQIEAMGQSQTLTTFLYMYRSLTDSELEKYIQFATSDAGAKYHSVTSEALKKALADCSMKWGSAVVKVFENADGQSDI